MEIHQYPLIGFFEEATLVAPPLKNNLILNVNHPNLNCGSVKERPPVSGIQNEEKNDHVMKLFSSYDPSSFEFNNWHDNFSQNQEHKSFFFDPESLHQHHFSQQSRKDDHEESHTHDHYQLKQLIEPVDLQVQDIEYVMNPFNAELINAPESSATACEFTFRELDIDQKSYQLDSQFEMEPVTPYKFTGREGDHNDYNAPAPGKAFTFCGLCGTKNHVRRLSCLNCNVKRYPMKATKAKIFKQKKEKKPRKPSLYSIRMRKLHENIGAHAASSFLLSCTKRAAFEAIQELC